MLRHQIFRAVLLLIAGAALGNAAEFYAPVEPPRARYTIDARIDAADNRLHGVETIRFTNTGKRPLARLALDWRGSSNTPRLSVAGKPVPFIGDDKNGVGIPHLFDLPQPVAPGGSIAIRVEFSTRFNSTSAPVTHGRWHPRLWWGFDVHTDYDVKLEAPPEFTIATSGRLVPATGRWQGSGFRSFGIFFGRGLKAAEATAGDTLVRAVFTPAGEPCARLLLATAADAVSFYRKRFGFFPYRSLTIVPGGKEPYGGYPIASGLVAIHGQEKLSSRPETFWKWITAHEVGHQYWLEHVLARNPNEGYGWLLIGLGIFADREYSRTHGMLDRHAGFLRGYAEAAHKGIDTTLDRTADDVDHVDWDFNNIGTHDKGFTVISALASVLGRDAFDRVYLRALKEYGKRRLGWQDFERICEEESGQSLDWFFEQWVRSNRYPFYRIASQASEKRGGEYVTQVTVESRGTLRMPVPVEAEFEDGTRTVKQTDRLLASNVVEFRSKAPLKEARLDPQGELVFVVEPELTASDVQQKIRTSDLTGAGKAALDLLEQARKFKLAPGYLWFRLGLMLYDGQNYEPALDAFAEAAKAPDNEEAALGLIWQGIVCDVLGQREAAVRYYRAALEKNPEPRARHDQYGLAINRKWVEERIETPYRRP